MRFNVQNKNDFLDFFCRIGRTRNLPEEIDK